MSIEFKDAIEAVGKTAELVGVGVTTIGVAASLLVFGYRWLRMSHLAVDAYSEARRNVGRSILLGLEVLVAGDIIRTVAVSPSFTSVGVLAVIVGVRTFLSFTLEVEVTSRWPWQKEQGESRGTSNEGMA